MLHGAAAATLDCQLKFTLRHGEQTVGVDTDSWTFISTPEVWVYNYYLLFRR